LAAAALCTVMPTGAIAAKGGGGGTPPPTSAPCVQLVPTNPGKSFSRAATVDANFGVSNCSASPVTLSTGFTSVSTAWAPTPITPTPVPCAGPSGSGDTLTLKPGEQRTVRFSVPPTGCPVGPGGAILEVDAVARSGAATLATAVAFYQLTIKP
jgi:hypothetical protein